MESNSLRNRILCSEKSYNLLREQAPDILTHKRGKIAVKGKGDMTVYWVGGSRWVGGFPLKRDDIDEDEQKTGGKRVGFSDDEEDAEPLEQIAA